MSGLPEANMGVVRLARAVRQGAGSGRSGTWSWSIAESAGLGVTPSAAVEVGALLSLVPLDAAALVRVSGSPGSGLGVEELPSGAARVAELLTKVVSIAEAGGRVLLILQQGRLGVGFLHPLQLGQGSETLLLLAVVELQVGQRQDLSAGVIRDPSCKGAGLGDRLQTDTSPKCTRRHRGLGSHLRLLLQWIPGESAEVLVGDSCK